MLNANCTCIVIFFFSFVFFFNQNIRERINGGERTRLSYSFYYFFHFERLNNQPSERGKLILHYFKRDLITKEVYQKGQPFKFRSWSSIYSFYFSPLFKKYFPSANKNLFDFSCTCAPGSKLISDR